jgi:hypothetical protein
MESVMPDTLENAKSASGLRFLRFRKGGTGNLLG